MDDAWDAVLNTQLPSPNRRAAPLSAAFGWEAFAAKGFELRTLLTIADMGIDPVVD